MSRLPWTKREYGRDGTCVPGSLAVVFVFEYDPGSQAACGDILVTGMPMERGWKWEEETIKRSVAPTRTWSKMPCQTNARTSRLPRSESRSPLQCGVAITCHIIEGQRVYSRVIDLHGVHRRRVQVRSANGEQNGEVCRGGLGLSIFTLFRSIDHNQHIFKGTGEFCAL
jgi:hypothetical protein